MKTLSSISFTSIIENAMYIATIFYAEPEDPSSIPPVFTGTGKEMIQKIYDQFDIEIDHFMEENEKLVMPEDEVLEYLQSRQDDPYLIMDRLYVYPLTI